MSTSIVDDSPTRANQFDTTIHVAGSTVRADEFPDGMLAVILEHGVTNTVLTPAEACALAAALQAVGMHQMEHEPRELHRATEPGTPDLDGIGGGL